MAELDGTVLRDAGAALGIGFLSASIDPASIGAVASLDIAVTLPGVAVGDTIIAIPPATLTAGLAPQGVVATAGVGTLRLTNASAGAIDGGALTWTFLVIDRTPRL